jgi:hypothetical protein
MNNTTNEGLVTKAQACHCGEQRTDRLIWSEDATRVKCLSCGAVYSPTAKSRFEVQHEMDNEPTYVVDLEQKGPDGDPLDVVTFDPSIPVNLRRRLARMVKVELTAEWK